MEETKKKFSEGMWHLNNLADDKIREISSLIPCEDPMSFEAENRAKNFEEKSIEFDENWFLEKKRRKKSMSVDEILANKEKKTESRERSEAKEERIGVSEAMKMSEDGLFEQIKTLDERKKENIQFLIQYKGMFRERIEQRKKGKSADVNDKKKEEKTSFLPPVQSKKDQEARVPRGFQKKFNRVFLGSERARSISFFFSFKHSLHLC